MTDQIQTSIDRLRNKALELHQLVVKARHENQMLLNSNQALKDELDQQQTIGKNLLNENERLNQVIEASKNQVVEIPFVSQGRNDEEIDELVKEIFFNGRHYKLLFLLAMQAPMGIPPDLRTNIDFTFLLKNNNAISKLQSIYFFN